MKKLFTTAFTCLITLLSFHTFGQARGQICFIRAHGYVGSLVNDKVYIDDGLVCKLKNNQYSLHDVAAGKHTVATDAGGLSTQKKSAPFTVTVEEGKITYVNIIWANTVSCEEVTEASAKLKIRKLKQNTKCAAAP